MVFKIGLTGTIGSGKTEVSNIFSKLGIDILDCDLIAREILEGSQYHRDMIQQRCSERSILNESGYLNRKKLRQVIFNDENVRQWLCKYLHPYIFEKISSRLENVKSPYVVIVMPLLFECGYEKFIDQACVVTASENVKIKRVCARDKVSQDEVRQILSVQGYGISDATVRCDFVENNNGLEELNEKIECLHKKYLSIALSLMEDIE